VDYSQNWLNLLRDDHNFFYIFLWMIAILAVNKVAERNTTPHRLPMDGT
jgi:hypothetical protein